MTSKQARMLYSLAVEDVGNDSLADELWWKAVEDEMRRVVEAPTDRKAADVIRWWGNRQWGEFQSATALARHIREVWKEEMQG